MHRNTRGAAIGVLEGDSPWPVGMALPAWRDEAGVALWRLTVHKQELPGVYRVIDRRFILAQESGRDSSS